VESNRPKKRVPQMKAISISCLLIALTVLSPAYAQVIITGGQNASQVTEVSTVPTSGIFWSASGKLPPSPFDPLPQLPLYQYGPAGDDEYIYDDRNFDYSALEQSSASEAKSASAPSVTVNKTPIAKASAADPMFEFLNGVPELSITVRGSNATLTWPSSAGNLYLIESAPDLLHGLASGGGIPWTILTNALPAAAAAADHRHREAARTVGAVWQIPPQPDST
jgi:hypothetical protein